MPLRTALVAGASGLVGGHVLRALLQDEGYTQVTALVRKQLPVGHPKLTQQLVDFDRLAELRPFPRADDVFCCLGTTIRKARSRDAFYKVDFTYVHELARLASQHGAKQFLLVSSVGADPKSRLFYSRVKGKIEEALRWLPFQAIHIIRPSLLVGKRPERRPGERGAILASRVLSFALVGPLRKYRPIPAEIVAAAMVRAAEQGLSGVQVWDARRLNASAARSSVHSS